MKKLYYYLTLLTYFYLQSCTVSDWTPVSVYDVTEDDVYNYASAIDSNNVNYNLYLDKDYKLQLAKFDKNVNDLYWDTFYSGVQLNPDDDGLVELTMAISNGDTPYIAFGSEYSKKVKVMKLVGSSLEQVGSELDFNYQNLFGENKYTYRSLKLVMGGINRDIPILMLTYEDIDENGLVYVYKFDGNDWTQLGGSINVSSMPYIGDIAVTNTTNTLNNKLFVTCVNSSNELEIKKFNGTEWVSHGLLNFESGFYDAKIALTQDSLFLAVTYASQGNSSNSMLGLYRNNINNNIFNQTIDEHLYYFTTMESAIQNTLNNNLSLQVNNDKIYVGVNLSVFVTGNFAAYSIDRVSNQLSEMRILHENMTPFSNYFYRGQFIDHGPLVANQFSSKEELLLGSDNIVYSSYLITKFNFENQSINYRIKNVKFDLNHELFTDWKPVGSEDGIISDYEAYRTHITIDNSPNEKLYLLSTNLETNRAIVKYYEDNEWHDLPIIDLEVDREAMKLFFDNNNVLHLNIYNENRCLVYKYDNNQWTVVFDRTFPTIPTNAETNGFVLGIQTSNSINSLFDEDNKLIVMVPDANTVNKANLLRITDGNAEIISNFENIDMYLGYDMARDSTGNILVVYIDLDGKLNVSRYDGNNTQNLTNPTLDNSSDFSYIIGFRYSNQSPNITISKYNEVYVSTLISSYVFLDGGLTIENQSDFIDQLLNAGLPYGFGIFDGRVDKLNLFKFNEDNSEWTKISTYDSNNKIDVNSSHGFLEMEADKLGGVCFTVNNGFSTPTDRTNKVAVYRYFNNDFVQIGKNISKYQTMSPSITTDKNLKYYVAYTDKLSANKLNVKGFVFKTFEVFWANSENNNIGVASKDGWMLDNDYLPGFEGGSIDDLTYYGSDFFFVDSTSNYIGKASYDGREIDHEWLYIGAGMYSITQNNGKLYFSTVNGTIGVVDIETKDFNASFITSLGDVGAMGKLFVTDNNIYVGIINHTGSNYYPELWSFDRNTGVFSSVVKRLNDENYSAGQYDKLRQYYVSESTGKVYWAEAGLGYKMSPIPDGNTMFIYQNPLASGIYVDESENNIYYGLHTDTSAVKISQLTGAGLKTLLKKVAYPSTIKSELLIPPGIIEYGVDRSEGGTADLANVTTQEVSNIEITTATFNGTVVNDGGASIEERGFVYSTTETTPNVINSEKFIDASTTTGVFAGNLINLTPNKEYYVRAYAKNSVGVAYGSVVTFRTKATEPTIQSKSITFHSITKDRIGLRWTAGNGTSRVILASKTSLNADNLITDGTQYTAGNFGQNTLENNSNISVVFNGSNTTCLVQGLARNTTYHFRIYDYNGSGSSSNYLMNSATGNPSSRATSKREDNNNVVINEDILVYPNPVNDNLNIEFVMSMANAKIQVVDENGKEILTLDNVNQLQTINTLNLAVGVYHLLITNNGETYYHSFVIQR